jgi:hypothetical protein
MGSIQKKVVSIAVSSRQKGPQGDERRRQLYGELLTLARKVVRQAGRVTKEMGGFSRPKQRKAKTLVEQIGTISERVRQVIRQTKARVCGGNTQVPDKIVSVFETHTEIIRKGKASKPTEFGQMIKIQEAENQVITDYEVSASVPTILICWFPRSRSTKKVLAARPTWSPLMPVSIHRRMKKHCKKWASKVSRYRTETRSALLGGASRNNDGSKVGSDGGPAVKGGLVF